MHYTGAWTVPATHRVQTLKPRHVSPYHIGLQSKGMSCACLAEGVCVCAELTASCCGCRYVVLNRPYAFVQWLQGTTITEKYVFMSEPDHVWLKPMPNLMVKSHLSLHQTIVAHHPEVHWAIDSQAGRADCSHRSGV